MQDFVLAIPACIDQTGEANEYKNLLSDMLYTAIYNKQRFSLIDRGEMRDIEQIGFEDVTSFTEGLAESNSTTGTVAISKGAEQVTRFKQSVYENSKREKEAIIDRLQGKSDGILIVYITSVSDNSVGIDYRIVSKRNDITSELTLFAGNETLKIGEGGSLSIDRESVQAVADDITNNFPSRKLDPTKQIISIADNVVTINMGKQDNIVVGLRGFVMKVDRNRKTESEKISYRAQFEIIEVFDESAKARLIVDAETRALDESIHRSLRVGEPVKMK